MYTLNCIVFGDDPNRVFPILIAHEEHLIIWKVKIDLNDLHLPDAIEDVGVKLKPLTELSEVFTDEVESGYLHVVVRHPTVAQDITVVNRRAAYLKKGTDTPSAGAKPSAFSRKQDKREHLCNRPHAAADPVPVTLLEPIFAEFMDDCQNYQPTDCDNDFVRQLSDNMSSFYLDEFMQMYVFW